ncbi:MAG: VgrG-related protein [Acidimicrobiia bacterium]
MAAQHPSPLTVEVAGSPLPPNVTQRLMTAYVDDNLHLPDLFVLTFRDPDRTVLKDAGIDVGAPVVVSVVADSEPAPVKLLTGEVTALEAEFGPGGSFTVVRGFDHAHRLFRGRVAESYRNVTYSDVAKAVAERVGLPTGRIDATTTVFPQVTQGNSSDWEFLSRLAREIGYEVAVVDGKLDFRTPAEATGAPGSGDLRSADPLQLVPGKGLIRFRSTLTSAEQVKEVRVRGWDSTAKQAMIGAAPAATTSTELSVKPDELAGKFGAATYTAPAPSLSRQADVDAMAKAIADQIAGAFAELEGVARGNPKLRAGTPVSLGLAGDPFDGRYTLTTTRHLYDPDEGYTTIFTASGRNERSLLGLVSGGGSMNANGHGRTGVASALVTDVRDPDGLCRVKLRFPWMSDSYESDWVRTVQPGAGKDRGSVTLPEVNDEVLVAFEGGDMANPYVLGGLYNGVDKPNLGEGLVDAATGGVARRGFLSRKGHGLVFLDGDGDEGVAVLSGDRQLRLSLNQSTRTVKVTSSGDVVIEGKGALRIQMDGDVELAGQKVAIKGAHGATVDGGEGGVQVKGSGLDLEGTGAVSLKGASVEVSGDATSIKGGNTVAVSAPLVKIN